MSRQLFNHGWAVKSPGGQILANTFSIERGECYWLLWGQQDEAFRTKYWKRYEASCKAYRCRGYRIVQVQLVETNMIISRPKSFIK